MSVWAAEEIMRRGVRFCSLRCLWQQHCFPGRTSIRHDSIPTQQVAHIWGTKQSHTDLSGSLARSVRFYSQDRIVNEDLKEKEPLLPPLEESSLPTEVQTVETASGQTQRRSPFYDHLQRCKSPLDVLDVTCQYPPTVHQVSICLTHMWSAMKKMSDEQQRYELQLTFEHAAFDRLLQSAMKNVHHMHCDDIAYALLAMVKLGVPRRSRVVQTFLRNCQEKLNEFEEKGLSILATSLADMEDTPNVVALKKGMRLVVEERLPKIKNVVTFQTMMRLLGKDAPPLLKRKLEEKALSMKDQFSFPNTQHMISNMAAMRFHSKPLLDICSQRIRGNLQGIPFNRLLNILLSCLELRYKNMDLLTDISDYSSSMINIWSKRQLIPLLSVFSSLNFCPDNFMEAFAKMVIANPDVLTLKDALCVLKVYSTINYDLQHRRQPFLETLSQVLDSYLPRMSGFELLKTVYHQCLLGYFPSAPLQQLLQSSTLEQLETTDPKYLRRQERMFQTVDLCLRLDRPPIPSQLTIPPSLLGEPAAVPPSPIPWLSQGLQSALEDQAGVTMQEMVLVENFYLVDAVITKPPLGQSSVSSRAGEASSPVESSQRIAVIYAPHSFCYGTTNPCGPLAVEIRHLRILGYDHVLVMEQQLQAMPEQERTETLRRLIFPEHHRSDTQTELVQEGP